MLFRVRSYKDYGSLSGRSVDDMIAGARVEVAPYKEDPMDFVLWKPSDDTQPGWDSPWGRGRPGWHIECSAMAHEILGEAFDIHGGGNDLTFPHHENEIAQSKCAGHDFANIWMHNEMLQVEGKKMSKSLGNFFTVRDLLDQGVPGDVIRFVMLSTHYRKPMDWTERKRADAEKTLSKWFGMTENVRPDTIPPAVKNAIADDLNAHKALTLMHAMASGRNVGKLRAAMEFVGFSPAEEVDWFRSRETKYTTTSSDKIGGVLNSILQRLDKLRSEKRYDEADELKNLLEGAGLKIRFSPEGIEANQLSTFDPSKLEALK